METTLPPRAGKTRSNTVGESRTKRHWFSQNLREDMAQRHGFACENCKMSQT
jgi:hypothetical protein